MHVIYFVKYKIYLANENKFGENLSISNCCYTIKMPSHVLLYLSESGFGFTHHWYGSVSSAQHLRKLKNLYWSPLSFEWHATICKSFTIKQLQPAQIFKIIFWYYFFFREDHEVQQTNVLFKRPKHHKGSIYCCAWNATGDIIATGSNDKTIRMTRFDSENCNAVGESIEILFQLISVNLYRKERWIARFNFNVNNNIASGFFIF